MRRLDAQCALQNLANGCILDPLIQAVTFSDHGDVASIFSKLDVLAFELKPC